MVVNGTSFQNRVVDSMPGNQGPSTIDSVAHVVSKACSVIIGNYTLSSGLRCLVAALITG